MKNNAKSENLAKAIINNQKTMQIKGIGLEERPKKGYVTPRVISSFEVDDTVVLVKIVLFQMKMI